MRGIGLARRIVVGSVLALCLTPGQGRAEGPTALADARNRMVDEEIVNAGIENPRVIAAMRATPRHEFVPMGQRANSYYDMALPIGEGQTISPPFVVAYMTEALDPQPEDKVLEIGTGSGYQAAVLSGLVHDVYSIEIVAPLGQKAAKILERLHYRNVHTKVGDGYQGWSEHAPFDKIIVTCSPEKVPPALTKQLKEGGRMVVPVGQRYQQTLFLLKKVDGKLKSEKLVPTLFVPMTGKAEQQRKVLPDPTKPTLENGDFEDTFGDPPQPAGWHYQRQLKVVTSKKAPVGENYVRFTNEEPGRGAQALQAFAIDGRKVPRIEISAQIRGRDLQSGQSSQQQPNVAVIFYDEKRAVLGERQLGPWVGTFDWRFESKRFDVPPQAREAIVRIGMFGGIGSFSIDDIRVRAVKK